jgi:hypothetical protein
MQNSYSLFNGNCYYSCTVHALVEIMSSSYLFLFQSHNVKVCDIDDDVKDALKKFRFRKNDTNAALISKCLSYIVIISLKYYNNFPVKCNFLNVNVQLLRVFCYGSFAETSVYWVSTFWGPVAGFYKHDNEHLVSVKQGFFFDKVSSYTS